MTNMEMVSYWWSVVGFLAFVRGLLPTEAADALHRLLRSILDVYFLPYASFEVPEFDGPSINELYRNVQLHLTAKDLCRGARKTVLCKVKNSTNTTSTLAGGESVVETFNGAKIWWTHTVQGRKLSDGSSQDHRMYTLKMHKRDRDRVMPAYLDSIHEDAHEYQRQNREMLLYSNNKSSSSMGRHLWQAVHFKHPSTFETLAMEPSLLHSVKADLDAFLEGRNFFQRVGRPWKRGYLLYGPAGTGKSSMIAAMANYLKYDVYDLELTQVRSNSELKQLLIQTTNKSIIVIEDIDCSVCLSQPRAKFTSAASKETFNEQEATKSESADGGRITLSGLLNFTDGLWSCCGNERILVFTTNHIEKLDDALLRPGRMDLHIHMSFCSFSAFKILVRNYLLLDVHELYPEVESLIKSGARATPAQISEILVQNKANHRDAMEKVVSFLEDPEHHHHHHHHGYGFEKVHPDYLPPESP